MLAAASADVACTELCCVTDRNAASAGNHLGLFERQDSALQLYAVVWNVKQSTKSFLSYMKA
jgi:hypothetical protein